MTWVCFVILLFRTSQFQGKIGFERLEGGFKRCLIEFSLVCSYIAYIANYRGRESDSNKNA